MEYTVWKGCARLRKYSDLHFEVEKVVIEFMCVKMEELLNFQNVKGKANPQVRQFIKTAETTTF